MRTGPHPLLLPRRGQSLPGADRPRKKLLEAARRWCEAAAGPDELAEDEALFGLAPSRSAPADCIVLPENWDVVRTFLAASTQWRLGPNGELLGLDYAGARAAARGLGLKWRAVFEGLCLMEGEAVRCAARERSGRRTASGSGRP